MTDTSVIAAYVSAGVAFAVGIVKPLVSNRKAGDRLQQQLMHDLSMKQRDERIALLDSVAQALTKMQRSTDEVLDLWRDGVPATDAEAKGATASYWDHLEELRQVRARLAMRYPEDHEIFKSFDRAQKSQEKYRDQVSLYQAGAPYHVEVSTAVRDEAVDKRRAWLAEARKMIDAPSS